MAPRSGGPPSSAGRVHILDTVADPEWEQHEAQRLGGYRTVLAVPMLRQDELIGLFFMWRTEVRAFTDKQIDLVATFADQAVIAIENARLFNELQGKNADLTEALEQQTATSEILRVISQLADRSPAVFDAVAESAARLCGAIDAGIFRVDGELHLVASGGSWADRCGASSDTACGRPRAGDRARRGRSADHPRARPRGGVGLRVSGGPRSGRPATARRWPRRCCARASPSARS